MIPKTSSISIQPILGTHGGDPIKVSAGASMPTPWSTGDIREVF